MRKGWARRWRRAGHRKQSTTAWKAEPSGCCSRPLGASEPCKSRPPRLRQPNVAWVLSSTPCFTARSVVCPKADCESYAAPEDESRSPFPSHALPPGRDEQIGSPANCAGNPACLRKQASRETDVWLSIARLRLAPLEPRLGTTTRNHTTPRPNVVRLVAARLRWCVCVCVCPCFVPFPTCRSE